jgi:hypothetical protein
MNWRRGLFRLWIIGAALFAIAVACVSYSDIKAEFDRSAKWWAGAPVVSEPKTVKFRGQLNQFPADFTASEIAAALKTTVDDPELRPQLRLSDAEVGIVPPNPWATVGVVAAIAFGIPLVLLILGASLVWALSGFAAARP